MTYTFIAIFGVGALAFWCDRASTREQKSPFHFEDDLLRQSIVFARQDLRLIAYVLAAIFVMLGVISDKIH
jgi:hypothetical protein